MGAKKISRKSKVRPFVKNVNYGHIIPTRYVLGPEFDMKSIVVDESMNQPEDKKKMKESVRKLFEEKYEAPATTKDEKSTSAEYFFKKLKF